MKTLTQTQYVESLTKNFTFTWGEQMAMAWAEIRNIAIDLLKKNEKKWCLLISLDDITSLVAEYETAINEKGFAFDRALFLWILDHGKILFESLKEDLNGKTSYQIKEIIEKISK